MISAALQAEIEKLMKVKILTVSPLSAANNAQIFRLALTGGKSLVVKVSDNDMTTEAYMLNYLREKAPSLPLPQVYYSTDNTIVMEFIDSHYTLDDAAERHAAEVLSALHRVHAEAYGHERDTVINSLAQPNAWNK